MVQKAYAENLSKFNGLGFCPCGGIARWVRGAGGATAVFLLWPLAAGGAGFPLNWDTFNATQPANHFTYVECGRTVESPMGGCAHQDPVLNWPKDNTTSPFLQEVVYIDSDNNGQNERYYHVIVGELGANQAGFALEYYISAASCCVSFETKAGNPWSQSVPGYAVSASGGKQHWVYAKDPLGNLNSGTASGNPEKVVMRMRLTEADPAVFSLDVVKANLATKPAITQAMSGTDWSSLVQIDGSATTYQDATTSAAFVNRWTLTDPDIGTAGNFDMATSPIQVSTLSPGRYSYAPGVLLYTDTPYFCGSVRGTMTCFTDQPFGSNPTFVPTASDPTILKDGTPVLHTATGSTIPYTGTPYSYTDSLGRAHVEHGREGAGGTYNYWDSQFNLGSVNWQGYRDPAQNP